MRSVPVRWPILLAALLMLTAAATIFRTVEIDNQAAWLLMGAALTLLGEWAAMEIYFSVADRAKAKELEVELDR